MHLVLPSVVRSADKLRNLLMTKHGLTEDDLQPSAGKLLIIEGDVRTLDDVKRTLQLENGSPSTAHLIISGIGGVPKGISLGGMRLQDPHIGEVSTKVMLAAIAEIRRRDETYAPVLLGISTIGLGYGRTRDLPYLQYPIYTWLLREPFADKRVFEQLVMDAHREGHIRAILVRASMLTDGKSKGMSAVRVGSERLPSQPDTAAAATHEHDGQPLPIGFTIARDDVGVWIYEAVIKPDLDGSENQWAGRAVTVTY